MALPAVKKKEDGRRFLAHSGNHDWRTGFTRRIRSWYRLGYDDEALRRRRGLAGVERWRREKQRNRKETNGDGTRALKAARKQREATQGLLRASAKPRAATATNRMESKHAGDEVSSTGTVHRNYRTATGFETQITPKFV